MEGMAIVINSSGRPNRILTIRQFPSSILDDVFIVVPHEQAETYCKENKGYPIMSLPEDCPPYLSSQRQWVMENLDYKYRYIFYMDDDLRFMKRRKDMRLTKCTDDEMLEMFDLVHKHIQDVPVVGISTQLGNNRITEDFEDIVRVTRCYCVDRKVFNEIGATFAPYEPFCMQDFHVNLTFLENGYPNRVLYTFAQEDVGSGAKGGCSQYRTFEVLEKAAKYITAKHFGSADFRVKKSKSAWDGMGKKDEQGNVYRVDIVVHWKRAYKPRKKREEGSGIFKFFK
jgi:hypothetical protein